MLNKKFTVLMSRIDLHRGLIRIRIFLFDSKNSYTCIISCLR